MGANDGILSTASLILGIAAAGATGHTVLITGIAGLVAGAMSMAAGEYVSVSSQADTEGADLVREGKELDTDDKFERAELAEIYVSRGLDPALARQVANQLMVHDALGAHARDELGISEIQHARPVLAAFASAGTFAIGAALPLMVVLLAPAKMFAVSIVGT
ncbi:MAG: VIT1/CCC1 transporter family protein, partial [Syntrophales bacterium]